MSVIGRICAAKMILTSRRRYCIAGATIFLIATASIVGMVSCGDTGAGDYHCLTIASTEGGSVTNPGEGRFTCYTREMVALVAEPGERYHFVEWTGDVDSIADVRDASTSIVIYDSYSITANFELDEGWTPTPSPPTSN